MSTLRDDLIPVIDEGRALADELGLRQQTIVLRTRVWSGGVVGRGTAADTELTIAPVPKVRRLPLRLIHGAGGRYQQGDRQITKISAGYTREQLGGGDPVAGTERLWLIDGAEHVAVETVEQRNFEWRVVVRRRR